MKIVKNNVNKTFNPPPSEKYERKTSNALEL